MEQTNNKTISPTNDSEKDVILEEYRNTRSEIMQLNSQAFTAVNIFLVANMTILGWMLSRDNPSEYCLLPALGMLILFCGCILMRVRDRLAHRLAAFQRCFIEKNLPDIYWSRAYFFYRKKFDTEAGYVENSFGERLTKSNRSVLIVAQVVNFVVFLYYAFIPLDGPEPCIVDPWKLVFFIIMATIFGIQWIVEDKLDNNENIDKTMEAVASELLEK